jgi:hypothetical protein
MKKIKVFLASSASELFEERQKIPTILSNLTKPKKDLIIETIKWETDLPSGSYNKEKIQDEINPKLEESDINFARKLCFDGRRKFKHSPDGAGRCRKITFFNRG